MQLLEINENKVDVQLDWADVRLLTHALRHAIGHDVGSTVADFDMVSGYLNATVAFLEAAGMASRAHTVDRKDFTLYGFERVVPLTPEEREGERR